MTVPKFNILIVDDEPLARNRLKTLSRRLDHVGTISMAEGGEAALQHLKSYRVDLLLLDVDMPDLSGMEVANKCQSMEDVPEIIFTTAHSKYAVEAFRLNAADYLLKPVKEALLREAFERALDRADRKSRGQIYPEDQRLWVKDERGSVQIRVVDIERIEADRDYMRLCLAGLSYLVHGSMRSFEDTLPAGVFVRVHRSAMVRTNFIQEVRRKGRRLFVVMKDGAEIPVGPTYLNGLVKAMSSQAGGLGGSETVTE